MTASDFDLLTLLAAGAVWGVGVATRRFPGRAGR